IWNEEVPGPLNYRPVVTTRSGPDPKAVVAAVDLLLEARKPVLYAGQGIHYAKAWPQLRALAERLAIPVCTSLEGKSAFPEDHPLALGAGGAAVPLAVRQFLDQSDVIFGIGCSFTETSFGVAMPRGKRVIHGTLAADHINKDIEAEVALVGDAALILEAMLAELERRGTSPRSWTYVADEIARVRAAWLKEWMPKLTS